MATANGCPWAQLTVHWLLLPTERPRSFSGPDGKQGTGRFWGPEEVLFWALGSPLPAFGHAHPTGTQAPITGLCFLTHKEGAITAAVGHLSSSGL